MVNNGNPFVSGGTVDTTRSLTNKADGEIIQKDHINHIHVALDIIAKEFNTQLTKKLKLFTSTTSSASVNLPSGSDPTSNLTAGDLWNNAGTLKFYDGSTTKTLAFDTAGSFTDILLGNSATEPTTQGKIFRTGDVLKYRAASASKTIVFSDAPSLSSPTLTTPTLSGVTNAATINATAVTMSAASTVNATMTISTSSTTALRVTDTANNIFVVNTSGKIVSVRNGTDFVVFASDTTNEKLRIDGSTGDITSLGKITSTSTATSAFSGSISVPTGKSFLVDNVAYLPPADVHTGGFTMIIGNGVDAINASTYFPVVIFPYDCTITYWAIRKIGAGTANDEASITLNVQKNDYGAATDNAWSTIFSPSSASSTRGATGTVLHLMSQNQMLRAILSGTTTLKQIAFHIRVVKR